MSEGRYAFATLVTSDGYLPGALNVAAALKEVHPSPPVEPEVPFKTVCIVTPETVEISTIKHLRRAFDIVFGVEVIEEETGRELELLGRPDLKAVLTKLHVFRLTQFDKVIFLDADVLPIRPLSHLFKLPYEFAAVPDVGWPDIFNSGMMVLTPGPNTFDEIMEVMRTKGSWDGGDQGVLNEWRGDNWHRLKFTYNTTPHSAYGFKPAWGRFGSMISAIHFIGAKKPWHDLPFRAPSTASQHASQLQTHDSSSSEQSVQTGIYETPSGPISITTMQPASSIGAPLTSFSFSDLVDRWYDVYDRNYRQLVPATEEEYLAKRYDNAWDESSFPSQEVDRSGFGTVSSGPMALEDLRRLAVEGTGFNPSHGSEGEYRSLPLEGRIDLMRPKKASPQAGTPQELTPTGRVIDLHDAPAGYQPAKGSTSQSSHVPDQGGESLRLPLTPGPNEVPPSPYLPAKSLSPSTPSSSHLSPSHNSLALTTEPTHAGSPHAGHLYVSHTENAENAHGDNTSRQQSWQASQGNTYQDHENNQGYQHVSQHPEQQTADPPRPLSPPIVSWNPAIEPPPNVAPTHSSFPADTFYPNAWDIPTGPTSSKLHADLTGSTLSSTSFFEAPPPSKIPDRLIQEGHYQNVMGNQPEPTQQQWQPNYSKVTSVFPWEQRPRHTPGRVFPAGEAPPTIYIEDMQTSSETAAEQEPEDTSGSTVVGGPEVKAEAKMSPPLTAPAHYRGSRSFSNAWDAVPSIQKYAARLVKPPAHASPMILQAPKARRRSTSTSYLSRAEHSDANSMDGDVEDEVDDDSDLGSTERFSSDERLSGSRRGSKTGSPAGSVYGESSKKKYRSYGVQTIPKEVRSVAIQVSQPLSDSTGPSSTSKKTHRSEPPPPILLPKHGGIQELESKPEQTALATPSVVTTDPFGRSTTNAHLVLPTGALSPRLHDAYTFQAPVRQSPGGSPGTQTPVTTRFTTHGRADAPKGRSDPAPFIRTSSNETADSPAGPASPIDIPQMPAARKPSGRIWNPSTGIDVFKRNSEEVLARFLRLGSWEDEGHAHSPGH